jgi:hypothetical protein
MIANDFYELIIKFHSWELNFIPSCGASEQTRSIVKKIRTQWCGMYLEVYQRQAGADDRDEVEEVASFTDPGPRVNVITEFQI